MIMDMLTINTQDIIIELNSNGIVKGVWITNNASNSSTDYSQSYCHDK